MANQIEKLVFILEIKINEKLKDKSIITSFFKGTSGYNVTIINLPNQVTVFNFITEFELKNLVKMEELSKTTIYEYTVRILNALESDNAKKMNLYSMENMRLEHIKKELLEKEIIK